MKSETENAGPRPAGKRPRRLLAALVAVALAMAVAPRVLSSTSLRDAVLQTLVGDSNLHVSSSGASFGWFSPLIIDDLKIQSSDGSVDISVIQLRAQRSCLALWLSAPEIGAIDVDRPRVELVIGAQPKARNEVDSDAAITSCPTFSVDLNDGSLVVREQSDGEPVLDARKIDVRLRTEQSSTGSMLIVDPITLADHEILTPEVCNQGIQLVAPQLADEIGMQGEYSVELTKLQLELGSRESDETSDASTIEGVVTLHQVSAGLKNDVTRRIAMAAAELMELGEVPDRIRLAENAELTFRLTHQRVSHEGMVFLFPDDMPGLSLRTSGSVALDESLDLKILIQVPLALLNETELARQIAKTPLEVRITGTIDEPILRVPDDQGWISQIKKRQTSADISSTERELADRIMEALRELQNEPSAAKS